MRWWIKWKWLGLNASNARKNNFFHVRSLLLPQENFAGLFHFPNSFCTFDEASCSRFFISLSLSLFQLMQILIKLLTKVRMWWVKASSFRAFIFLIHRKVCVSKVRRKGKVCFHTLLGYHFRAVLCGEWEDSKGVASNEKEVVRKYYTIVYLAYTQCASLQSSILYCCSSGVPLLPLMSLDVSLSQARTNDFFIVWFDGGCERLM